jgi:bacterioferritin (cytochrome b1)
VKATDELALLKEFHRQKVAQLRRHVAAARHISDYNFNNTYQYIIAREEMHETWLRDAILAMGGQPDEVPEPEVAPREKGAAGQQAILAADRDQAQALVDQWRPRIAGMANARNRTLLNVILGETLEHKRFFEQALAGRTDLLGPRGEGAGTVGVVLPTRWVE